MNCRTMPLLFALVLLWMMLLPHQHAPLLAQEAGAGAEIPEAIVLRVHTPEYRLDSEGVHVDGYLPNDVPGAPLLPVWRTVVELPPQGVWHLSYESIEAQRLTHAPPLPSVPAVDTELRAELYDGVSGPLPPAPEVVRPDVRIYNTNAWYPEAPVITGSEQWQRGRRLLAIQVSPFQYNPVEGTLLHHHDVRIHIAFQNSQQDPLERSASAPGVSMEPRNPFASLTGGGALRVYTNAQGMHRLTYSDLASAGVPVAKLDPASFAMSYLGRPVAIQVTGSDDGRFDEHDLIIFYTRPYEGRYMTENVYWLAYGGAAGERIATREVAPSGAEPEVREITRTVRVENNVVYMGSLGLPTVEDPWFDTPLSASGATTAERQWMLPVADALPGGTARVEMRLHGVTNQFLSPDHSVELQLNEEAPRVFQWEGASAFLASFSVPSHVLLRSTNSLAARVALSQFPPGFEPPSYTVYPDWIEVAYPAAARAQDDRLHIGQMREGAAEVIVEGFSAASAGVIRVFDVRDPERPVQLGTTRVQPVGGGFEVRFWDHDLPGPTYSLSADSALLEPLRVEADRSSYWRDGAHASDYIAIVHSSLATAIQPLLEHRKAEGLRVAEVDVQDIYDEFSYGRVEPEAIRAFLRHAYFNWNVDDDEPPTYVLLVGAGHYDFKRHSGTTLPNLIPPYLANVDPWIRETAADNRYVAVEGPDDHLPDMSLGRIPARDAADVAAVVDKIIQYETAAPTGDWQKRVVFVADSPTNSAGNFHRLSDVARLEELPPAYDDRTLYFQSNPDLDTGPKMRAAIRDAFDEGALMLQWFGHSSRYRWGSVSMFNDLDPPALNASTSWPLTVSYSCWSSYYIQIQDGYRALGEALLLEPERGSVADIGPTGLHVGSALVTLNQGITRAIFQERIDRVGFAADAGRYHYFAQRSTWRDIVDTTVLLGDPATKLRLPDMPRLLNSALVVEQEHAHPGAEVNFSIRVVNDGTSEAADVVLEIDYDQDSLTLLSSPGAADHGGRLIYHLEAVPIGTSTRNFSVKLAPSVPHGSTIRTSGLLRTPGQVDVALETSFVITAPPVAPEEQHLFLPLIVGGR
jgi:hypothetical protein